MNEIETNTYKWPASHTVKRLALEWIGRWWWAFACPLAAFCVIGLWDWRWYVVALALIFVAYPGIIAIAYYNIVLSPDAIRSILPQKAVFTDEALQIVYEPYAEGCAAPKPVLIPYNNIENFTDNGSELSIKAQDAVVEIPFTAFFSNDDAKCIMSILNQKTCKKTDISSF